jgi:hypothetical protein
MEACKWAYASRMRYEPTEFVILVYLIFILFAETNEIPRCISSGKDNSPGTMCFPFVLWAIQHGLVPQEWPIDANLQGKPLPKNNGY